MQNVCNDCGKKKDSLKNGSCHRCRIESRPKYECARCKKFRPAHRRLDGSTYCQSCSLHYRTKEPCSNCKNLSRIVAHGLCSSCYDKWRQEIKGLPSAFGTDIESFIVNGVDNNYEKMLFYKSKQSPYFAQKFGELMARKEKRRYEVQMILHDQCLFCDNLPEHQRVALGIKTQLCSDHYFTVTLGELTERVRVLYGPRNE